jgi:hypothetical protein
VGFGIVRDANGEAAVGELVGERGAPGQRERADELAQRVVGDGLLVGVEHVPQVDVVERRLDRLAFAARRPLPGASDRPSSQATDSSHPGPPDRPSSQATVSLHPSAATASNPASTSATDDFIAPRMSDARPPDKRPRIDPLRAARLSANGLLALDIHR